MGVDFVACTECGFVGHCDSLERCGDDESYCSTRLCGVCALGGLHQVGDVRLCDSCVPVCPVCSESVAGTEAFECDGCDAWLHRACHGGGVTERALADGQCPWCTEPDPAPACDVCGNPGILDKTPHPCDCGHAKWCAECYRAHECDPIEAELERMPAVRHLAALRELRKVLGDDPRFLAVLKK